MATPRKGSCLIEGDTGLRYKGYTLACESYGTPIPEYVNIVGGRRSLCGRGTGCGSSCGDSTLPTVQ